MCLPKHLESDFISSAYRDKYFWYKFANVLAFEHLKEFANNMQLL
jgi:hypothetical protein